MRKLVRDLNEKMEKSTGSSADLSAYKDVIDRFQKAIQSLVWITASRWSRMPGTDTKEDVKPIQDIIDQLYDMKDSIEDLMKMGPAVAEATGKLSKSTRRSDHAELQHGDIVRTRNRSLARLNWPDDPGEEWVNKGDRFKVYDVRKDTINAIPLNAYNDRQYYILNKSDVEVE